MGKKSTNYNDDEPVSAVPAAPPPSLFPTSGVEMNILNKAVPLEKMEYRLVVELVGFDNGGQKCGVDIVAVLDVSYTMHGTKLEKLKTAMKFLVKKLRPIDRLSIVTFSSDAKRLCPLTAMEKNGQANIEMLINKLDADGYTNITAGLQTAISVLAQRRQHEGRISAIMLMLASEPTLGCDHPSTVDISGVSVYTFGLGKDHDSQLLHELASSTKGTYSITDVEGLQSASLTIAFSSFLAGLFSVVVQDLELTITQRDPEIKKVRVGTYDQALDDNSINILFGNLQNREKRSTIVYLDLPGILARPVIDLLKISFTYRLSGGRALISSGPVTVTEVPTSSSDIGDELIEVGNEIARQITTAEMKMARELADANDIDEAQETMTDAEISLNDLEGRIDDLIFKTLKYEVHEYLRLLNDPETYLREGRAFCLSSELSHGQQRFAVRGHTTQLLPFPIPLAVLFANQAVKYDQNNNVELPSADEDEKELAEYIAKLEAAEKENKKALNSTDNLIIAQLGYLNENLGQVVVTLKAIQDSFAARQSA